MNNSSIVNEIEMRKRLNVNTKDVFDLFSCVVNNLKNNTFSLANLYRDVRSFKEKYDISNKYTNMDNRIFVCKPVVSTSKANQNIRKQRLFTTKKKQRKKKLS